MAPPVPTALPRGGREQRDRFVAFAFAGAELLIECTVEGRINFASGAFRTRFGREGEEFVGSDLRELFQPGDVVEIERAFALMLSGNRVSAVPLRLATRQAETMWLSGMATLPEAGGPPLLALCFAAPPRHAAALGLAGAAGGFGAAEVVTPDDLARAAEQRLKAVDPGGNPGGRVGLIELSGAVAPTDAGLMQEIEAAIAAEAGGNALASAIAPGRYGVLQPAGGERELDLRDLAARLEKLLQGTGLSTGVVATALPLEAGSLTGRQATRALRFALGAFARGGVEALSAAGFDGGLPGFVSAAGTRASAMRRMLALRRFRLAFQPIVNLRTRAVSHFESLLRPIPTPACPFAGPAEFVAFAEMVGIVDELDLAVAEAAAGVAMGAEGVRIAFNISGLSLESEAVQRRLLAMLDRTPGLVDRLMLEVTETTEIEDPAGAEAGAVALRQRGLPLCIDDFGAGAAGLSYLQRFRADYVKLDGHYVQRAVNDARDHAFVAAMVMLSHTAGAASVAERIETEEEAKVMAGLGVHYGQGWLFGRPGALPGSVIRAGRGMRAPETA
jgi:EAL domain-containing protein (putative c-di-GMP-specific phosphodiesterase class I)